MPLPAEAEQLRDTLAGMYEAVQQQHVDELVRLTTTPDPYGRIRIQRDRLRERIRALESALDELDASALAWIDGDLPELYRMGAAQGGIEFRWNAEHREAVGMLAQDTYDELLGATRYVRRDTKAFIREAAKLRVRSVQLAGRTAAEQGRALAEDLADRGIASVTYRNGARHGLGEYGSMVVRTKSALTYNTGTFQNGVAQGVEWFECYDGPDCGLTAHDDPRLANGLILPAREAFAYPIAHPNCARSWGPRPDISSGQQAEAARRYSPEEQQEMALLERQRVAESEARRTRPSMADRRRRRELTRANRDRRLRLRRAGRGAPV